MQQPPPLQKKKMQIGRGQAINQITSKQVSKFD